MAGENCSEFSKSSSFFFYSEQVEKIIYDAEAMSIIRENTKMSQRCK